jgi:uncharacterized BrkB/YihY/UPF0761 family membrane protein
MKGQADLSTFFGLIFVFVIALASIPLINGIIDTTIAQLETSPTSGTALLITVLRLLPYFVIILCILAFVFWFVPRRGAM